MIIDCCNIFPIRSYLSLLPQVSHGGAGVHPHGSVVQAQHLKQARGGVHGSNIINKFNIVVGFLFLSQCQSVVVSQKGIEAQDSPGNMENVCLSFHIY